MASRNPVVVSGNLVADPESFAFAGGSGVRLAVAESIRRKGADGWADDEPVFWPVTIWDGALGANVLASVGKGSRVTVVGHYRNNVWTDDAGARHSRIELHADEVAVSLLWATAKPTRVPRGASTGGAADEPPF
jgi:single-strand DNA-binding protein